MTEYEAIRKELESLGWTASQGKGDHTKFDKPGKHTITVSMRINANGRAYPNLLSNIRKQEPLFSIGKQKHHLKSDEDVPLLPDPPLQEYAFIRKGNPVRYTQPEKRDWSRLAAADSLMNIRYTVGAILDSKNMEKDCVTSPDDKVTIEHDGTLMTVPATALDDWETFLCSNCKRLFPKNIKTSPESTTCPDCEKEESVYENKFQKLMSGANASKEKEKMLNMKLKDFEEMLPKGFLEDYLPLMDCRLRDLPPQVKYLATEQILKFMKEKMKKSSADKKTTQQAIDAISKPYDVWKCYMANILMGLDFKSKLKADSTYARLRSNVQSVKYTVNVIDDQSKEFVITAKEPETAYFHIINAPILYSYLMIIMEKEECDYFVRVCCPSVKFDRYIPMGFPLADNDLLEISRHTATEEECDKYDLVRRASVLPDMDEIKERTKTLVTDIIEKNLKEEDRYECMFIGGPVYHECTSLEQLSTSEPQVRVICMLKLPSQISEIGDERAEKTQDVIDSHLTEVLTTLREEFDTEKIQLLSPKCMMPHELFDPSLGEEFSPVPFKRVQPYVKTANVNFIWEEDEIVRFMETVEERGDDCDMVLGKIFRRGLDRYFANTLDDETPAVAETTETIETSAIPMKATQNNDPLDSVNPSSEVEDFRNHSTRELLRELKSRGVEFSDITIPVVVVTKKSVSFDEL